MSFRAVNISVKWPQISVILQILLFFCLGVFVLLLPNLTLKKKKFMVLKITILLTVKPTVFKTNSSFLSTERSSKFLAMFIEVCV